MAACRLAAKRRRRPLGALFSVGGEGHRGPVVVGLEQLGDDAHVAVGDREAQADDRVVPAGRVADQHHALGERLIGPGVVVEIAEQRPGRVAVDEMAVAWAAGHGEGVEEAARAVRPPEALVLLQRVAAVDPHSSAALREGQEAEIALGADRLETVVPALDPVDQQATEPVVRLVLMQGDLGRPAHLGGAAVGADQQARRRLERLALHLVGHAWRVADGERDHVHAAQRRRPGRLGGVEQGLAVDRMAQAKRPWHTRRERAQGQRRGLGRGRLERLVVGDVTGDMMPAGFHQQLVQADPPHLGDAPGRDPLAAHLVLEDQRLFQQQHRLAGAGHHGRQG